MSPRTTQRKSTPADQLELAVQALRRIWLGGPDLRQDIVQAIEYLRRITPQIAATHEASATLDRAIEALSHLPSDEGQRRQIVERLAFNVKAIQPMIGAPDGQREIGKLNTALGERRAGRASSTKKTAKAAISSSTPVAMNDPVAGHFGFGGKRANALENLGIHTVQDVLNHVPRRHIDYSRTIRLDDPLGLRGDITVRGTLSDVRTIYVGTPRVTARLFDGHGSLRLVWFNTFVSKQLTDGTDIYVAGTVTRGRDGLQMTGPEWEYADKAGISTGGLIPVYSLTKGISQVGMRKLTRAALDATRNELKDWLMDARQFIDDDVWSYLPSLEDMYEHLHYPQTKEQFSVAHKRLLFQNLFLLQIGLIQQKATRQREPGRAIGWHRQVVDAFVSTLPFSLTGAQQRVLAEILSDLRQSRPMTRLLQGDVGSGKTVIAAIAARAAQSQGVQTAIMAPTELLAEQHAASIAALFDRLPEGDRPSIGLLTGSTRAAPRREILRQLAAGELDILIGTHALITEDVTFANLGLVIVDEQHRFGVRQRTALAAKAHGYQPHLLSMTATPIPRTLNLVLNGDLDVSILDERPPGRVPISTRAFGEHARSEAYDIVRQEAKAGRQAFVICPLVEGSDSIEARAAVDEAQRLQAQVFPDLKVDVLHGRMSAKAKDEVMGRFRDRQFDILVSTSVVEVGIDIPNATVMLIEGADRFGLAQLHQLRGRVGRGGTRSYCLLLSDDAAGDSEARLHTMVATDDGFVLAEKDLELRGPGDIIGTRQSGLPDLGWLSQGFDARMLDRARSSAERLIASGQHLDAANYPRLHPRLTAFWATRQPADASRS